MADVTAKLAALACAVALAGCDDRQQEVAKRTEAYDQCARAELFQACLAAVPAGPQATKYNDWDEVVSECGTQARTMSVRPVKAIKEGCRADY